MGKRLVAGLGAAVSLVLAAGCASSAGSVGAPSPAPAPRSSVSSPALTRIRERPAYEQLREHTRDIERLKSEF